MQRSLVPALLLSVVGVAAVIGACIIPDREIQVVVTNPCGEEWAAQTVGAYGYRLDGKVEYIKTDGGDWISEHYCFNHADAIGLLDLINSELAADMISHVILTCQARGAELGLADTDQTCATLANIAYVGECQHPKGGCEDPPAETGGDETSGETGDDGTTGGFAEFSDLDLDAEITFARGETLISNRLIDAALADPIGLAFDGTSLELRIDATGDPQGFEISGITRGNLGARLGLQNGDLLTDIDGRPTLSFEQLLDAAAHALSQEHITALILRDDEPISLRYRRN